MRALQEMQSYCFICVFDESPFHCLCGSLHQTVLNRLTAGGIINGEVSQCRQQFSKQTKELDQHNYQIREISIRNFRLKVEPSVESEMPEPWKWTLMKTALIDVLLCSIYKLNITLKDYKGAVKLSFNTFHFRNTFLFETQCWGWIHTFTTIGKVIQCYRCMICSGFFFFVALFYLFHSF